MTLLAVSHVSKTFYTGLFRKKAYHAVKDISFQIKEGEVLGLAGMSGAGKSTVIRIIMGLIPADGGQIFFQGKDLVAQKKQEWKKTRRHMQMLFQNPAAAVNPRMTIEEILQEPARLHHLPLLTKRVERRLLERFQLREELISRYPQELSGGELQRVALARLCILKPQLLLLDEPTSMLDVSVQAQVIHLLKELQQEWSMTCLFISHDLDLLHAVCSQIGIMKEGRLIELQKTEDLYDNPKENYTKELIQAFEDF